MSNFIKRCLDDIVLKQNDDIILSVFKQKEIYKENKKPSAREPKFLIAEEWFDKYQYRWYGKKVLDKWTIEHVDGALLDLGKFSEHNYKRKQCVCGLFYEGDFYPITNLNTFYYMLNMIKNEEILTKLEKLKK